VPNSLQFFEEIFHILQIQQNNIIVMAVYMCIHAVVILLRVGVFFGLRGHNLWMSANLSPAKGLKTLSGAKGIRSGLLRGIVIDYIAAAEKNAPGVPLNHIVDKHVLSLNLFGWRYFGIMNLTNKLENGLIFIGIILALIFAEYSMVYGIIAVAGFVLMKFTASIFDVDSAYAVLKADINIYIEREVGQFFAGHVALAMNRFKEDVSEAIERLNTDFVPVLEKLSELKDLPKAIESMQESNERYILHHDTFAAQSKMLGDNQKTLETSLASYEATLQNVVLSLGDGMGAFIKMHGQTAADGLSKALESQISQISASNQETLKAISVLTQQLSNQSKDISTNLRLLHERIEDM